MAKRPFIRKLKRQRKGVSFWDYEYTEGGNLKLSSEPSEDFEKFIRWLLRQKDTAVPRETMSALDVGCGNGRNLIYFAKECGVSGIGYDISSAAIAQAKELSKDLPIVYEVRSMAGDINLPDESQDFVLDMMASHFLNEKERLHLREEAYRVLRPGGWLFMKTFLLDGDLHSARLLKDLPGKEPNTYIHPVIGVPEHVYSEDDLTEFLEERFSIEKLYRSHQHISRGKARKRRTISIYAQKDPYI